MRIELYTSPRCRGCAEAKELAGKLKEENQKLDLRVIDISEEGGAEMAFKNKVMAMPTFLIIYDGRGKKFRVVGSDEKKVRIWMDVESKEAEEKGSTRFLKIGAGLGILSVVELVVLGAVCLPCLVMTIGYIAYGLFKRYFSKSNE